MDYQQARNYLLSRPEAWEDFPFDAETAVMKIKNKMFATLSLNRGVAATNLKCDPDEALMLRDIFAAVKPGYHMRLVAATPRCGDFTTANHLGQAQAIVIVIL